MENLSGILIPVGTILLVVLLQISFWLPVETKRPKPSDNKQQLTPTPRTENKKSSPKSISSKEPKPSAPDLDL